MIPRQLGFMQDQNCSKQWIESLQKLQQERFTRQPRNQSRHEEFQADTRCSKDEMRRHDSRPQRRIGDLLHTMIVRLEIVGKQ